MEILSRVRNLRRTCSDLRLANTLARAVASGVVLLVAASAADAPLDEYKVKAAFLYNFAKFIQWPSESFQKADSPLGVCVLGQDPFGGSLEETVTGRLVEARALIVRHITGVKQMAGCHILFVSSADNGRALAAIAEIRTAGILTIGDSDASGAAGVVINFRLASGRVRFEINAEAADREKLRISSRLLSLSHAAETTRK